MRSNPRVVLQSVLLAVAALFLAALLPGAAFAVHVPAAVGGAVALPESAVQPAQCRRICAPPICRYDPYSGRRFCRRGGCRLVCNAYPPRPYPRIPDPGPYRPGPRYEPGPSYRY